MRTTTDTTSPTTTTSAPFPAVATARRSLAVPARHGLVALHVADDSFLQPPAGTSATDHLASGLVPVALLAAAAWGYGRVRAGWRGVLALAMGIFGVGIGALEAGYYTAAVGPSGDDFTGLLAIPAGLLLVGSAP